MQTLIFFILINIGYFYQLTNNRLWWLFNFFVILCMAVRHLRLRKHYSIRKHHDFICVTMTMLEITLYSLALAKNDHHEIYLSPIEFLSLDLTSNWSLKSSLSTKLSYLALLLWGHFLSRSVLCGMWGHFLCAWAMNKYHCDVLKIFCF